MLGISPGRVETWLQCDGILFYGDFTTNVLPSLAAKNEKIGRIWQRYGQEYSDVILTYTGPTAVLSEESVHVE